MMRRKATATADSPGKDFSFLIRGRGVNSLMLDYLAINSGQDKLTFRHQLKRWFKPQVEEIRRGGKSDLGAARETRELS